MPDIKPNITKEIINEIIAATKQIMISHKLGNTELIESVEWKYKENVFMLLAYDYYYWVDTGRRPRARKVPVEPLIKWMKKKGITPTLGQTYNSVAYAIQNAIYRNGIKAKNMTYPIIGVTLDLLENYIAEDLSVQIAGEIATDLTFTLGSKS